MNEGNYVCSNEGPWFFFIRGDSRENTLTQFKNIQNHFTLLIKLGTKHPWLNWMLVCSNERSRCFLRGDYSEIAKIKYIEDI